MVAVAERKLPEPPEALSANSQTLWRKIVARRPDAGPTWLMALRNALRLRELADQSAAHLANAEQKRPGIDDWSALASIEIQARAAFTAAWASLGLNKNEEE